MQHGDDLAKSTAITFPELDSAMVTDAMRFHTDLRDGEARRPESLTATHAIVGHRRGTATTARLADVLWTATTCNATPRPWIRPRAS
jgi:hypothetical protein